MTLDMIDREFWRGLPYIREGAYRRQIWVNTKHGIRCIAETTVFDDEYGKAIKAKLAELLEAK